MIAGDPGGKNLSAMFFHSVDGDLADLGSA
jgi:hypothetical protein